MKKISWLVFIICFSCKESRTEEEQSINTDSSTIENIGPANVIRNQPYLVWDVDADNNTKRLNPRLKVQPDADSLIGGINQRYENVLLEKIRISKDTIYLEVKDSEYLTQRMGSSGPAQWIADVVINLTSVKGINYVNVQLKEGDHAGPGTWSLQDFVAIKESREH